jgi:hypothetical protein
MRQQTLRAVVIGIVFAASSVVTGATPSTSASASTGWTVMPTPVGAGYQSQVSCWSTSGCMSVGAGIMKWDGSSWTQVPYPGPPCTGAAPCPVVSALACISATDCIAVGHLFGTGPSHEGSLAGSWRWNGTAWASLTAYSTAYPDNILNAIWCTAASRCEAVGSYYGGSQGGGFPLAEVWNGTVWADQSTPGAPMGALDGVACESSGKCEAVGSSSDNALAMGLSGSRWIPQYSPPLGNPGNGNGPEIWSLTGVSCWRSGCIAVGNQSYAENGGNNEGTLGFAESWNGLEWSLLPGNAAAPALGNGGNDVSANWSAVHCHSASMCTAVGWETPNALIPEGAPEAQCTNQTSLSPSTGSDCATLVSMWNGSAWSPVPSPTPTPPAGSTAGSGLSGLACVNTPDRRVCTAVGFQPYVNSSGNTEMLAERH